jgi:hypothetical protein
MSGRSKPSVIAGRDTVVVASKDLVYTELDDGVTILSMSDGMYYGLNAVGAKIWGLIQEERKAFDILQSLLGQYHVEPGQCERDLFGLLNLMIDHGLVEVVSEGD